MASYKRTYSSIDKILKIVMRDNSDNMDFGELSIEESQLDTGWE